jgi:hypothetical protein
MLEKFSVWLNGTPPSLLIQNVLWIIPVVQGIHILAIGIIVSSLVMVDLKLVGIGQSHNSVSYLERRFMPWIWSAFWVLLASGLVLVVGEPKREIMNTIFRAKLILICALLIVASLVQQPTKRDPYFWEAPERVMAGRLIGILSLVILVATIACGRWIAYAGMLDQ